MTDKEKLVSCFKDLGIKFNEKKIEGQKPYLTEEYDDKTLLATTEIKISEGIGYYNFYCCFYFDKDDKFVGHGTWE